MATLMMKIVMMLTPRIMEHRSMRWSRQHDYRQIDEGVLSEFYFDNDNDGFGDETDTIEQDAIDGYVPNGNDCDDDDEFSYPSAPERCDGFDNDCDGDIDEDISECTLMKMVMVLVQTI